MLHLNRMWLVVSLFLLTFGVFGENCEHKYEDTGLPSLKFLRPSCNFSSAMITEGIQIVGMFNSGTTWLLRLVNENFISPKSMLHDPIYKHTHLDYVPGLLSQRKNSNFLYIILVKAPLHWLTSLERTPYGNTTGPSHYAVGQRHGVGNDLVKASWLGSFSSSPANMTLDIRVESRSHNTFGSAIEAYTSWHMAWLRSDTQYVFLRYEDVLEHPGFVLNEMEALFRALPGIKVHTKRKCKKEWPDLVRWEDTRKEIWICVEGIWVISSSVKVTDSLKEDHSKLKTNFKQAVNFNNTKLLTKFTAKDLCFISSHAQLLLRSLDGRFTVPGYPILTLSPDFCSKKANIDCMEATNWDKSFTNKECSSEIDCGGCFTICSSLTRKCVRTDIGDVSLKLELPSALTSLLEDKNGLLYFPLACFMIAAMIVHRRVTSMQKSRYKSNKK